MAMYGDNAKPGAVLGGLASGQFSQSGEPQAPRTIASAASRVDGINDRLSGLSEALSGICQQIGAMTAINQIAGNGASKPPSSGAVNRLNDSADDAHSRLSTIENYVASIQRALG